jgi:uncharacterized membrane protein YfcA
MNPDIVTINGSFSLIQLAGAAFGAGMLNAIAGGGTFLTFPALIFAGLPAISANATSAVAVMPGYVGGAIGFWREMLQVRRQTLLMMTFVTALGGAGGSLLLLVTPDRAFKVIVPWLLLFATLLFAASARPRARPGPIVAISQTPGAMKETSSWEGRSWWQSPAIGAVAIYGGYFNGGLGILLMAVLSLSRGMSLNAINGLKNYLSALLSVISIAVFATAGIVDWRAAVWMMGFSMVGGYAGARLAKRLPANLVYGFVVLTGLIMSAVFFRRL